MRSRTGVQALERIADGADVGDHHKLELIALLSTYAPPV